MFGAARGLLEENGLVVDSQKCVCFTETPLEYVHLLLEQIDNRQVQFEPYGVAFPKKIGRTKGVNPVWYIDITPGHDWLMGPINQLIEQALEAGGLDGNPIARLAPYIEQMGTHRDFAGNVIYRKEFWWEREWRRVGNFALPSNVIVLCPEAEFSEFRELIEDVPLSGAASFLDPHWGLEQIISRLTGYDAEDSDIL
jgi:hypothetical protein